MKVGLYLMNQKGFSILESLIGTEYSKHVSYVISSEDKNVVNDYYNEIHQLCVENNITFYNRKEFKVPDVKYKLAVGWRWLISDSQNLIVLHDSLLPKYRGFAPLVNSLINGETEIGVTALWANKEYDQGDILLQKKKTIKYPIKIQRAIDEVSELYINIVLEIFRDIDSESTLNSIKQLESEATYSLWRDDEDYRIDWQRSAEYIKRFIDAVGYPYKGAQATVDGTEIVYIDEVELMEDLNIELRQPGKVLKLDQGSPIVVCGTGLVKITQIRDSEGKKTSLKKFRTRFR